MTTLLARLFAWTFQGWIADDPDDGRSPEVITRIDLDTGMIEEVALFEVRRGTKAIIAVAADWQEAFDIAATKFAGPYSYRVVPWRNEVVRLFMREAADERCEGKGK